MSTVLKNHQVQTAITRVTAKSHRGSANYGPLCNKPNATAIKVSQKT